MKAILLIALASFADEPAPKNAETVAEVVVAGQVDKDDPADRVFGVRSKLHAHRFEKNKTYVVEVTSNGRNPFLHIDDSIGNVLMNGQNRTGQTSRARFTAPKDDVFLIYAGTHVQNDMPSPYTLTIKPYSPAPIKLIPLPAPAARKPSEVQSRLTHDDPPNQHADHPGKVHVIELTAGKTYVIDLISTEFDAFLILQDANAVIIAQDDDSGGNLNSRIRFQPTASGRYRLIASTFNGNVGAFTLRVTEQ